MASSVSSTDWAWNLLDEHDQIVRRLETVEYGATLEFNTSTQIRGGGTVKIVDAGNDIDWLTARLQPVLIDLDTGTETPWGVFLPVIPETAYTPVSRSWQGNLLDKTQILNSWKLGTTYTVEAGKNIVGAVRDLLTYAWQDRVAATPSPKTTGGAMVWEAGTSLLRIINDLLDATNYRAIWVDRTGTFRVEPYVLPRDRPVVGEFVEGQTATHRGDWLLSQDLASVPNHVVCIGQTRGEDPPLIGEATNDDPTSPFSVVNRRRRISSVYENVEAVDQATISAIAARRLVEASTPAMMLKGVKHALQPLDLSDVVRFRSQGVDRLATVERQVVTTIPGALMNSDLRAVSL